MALLQVVANEGTIKGISIINKANEYIKYDITSNIFNIPRKGDSISFEYLYFVDNKLTMEEFKKIIQNCHCTLMTCNTIIQVYDFKILIELNPIQKMGDTFIVKIPNYLVEEITIIAIQKSELTLCFNLIHQFEKISLLCKITYHTAENERCLISKMHERTNHHIYKSGEFTGKEINDKITLCGTLLTKGFFVIGQINNIQNLTLFLNGITRINYDSIVLKSIAHVISDNMFYISFEGSNNYTSISAESFVGALNLSRIDEKTMSLTLHEINICKYEIYFISWNFLNFNNGFAKNKYYQRGLQYYIK